ncbi:MAG: hypothetical protein WEA11_06115 [Acidimicrobiales bacterium]
MANSSHLARRFVGSLRPGGPSLSDRQWAERQLLDSERVIWCSLSGPDRRHSAAVARRVEQRLGSEASRPILAAALLHDCGKLHSGLRTPGRVVATVIAATIMTTPEAVAEWAQSSSSAKRAIGRYRSHPELGAADLMKAGSDPLTVVWTKEHHLPSSQWTLEPNVAAALYEADDD